MLMSAFPCWSSRGGTISGTSPADAGGADAEVGGIGADHHQPARKAISDHAADQKSRDLRKRPCRECEPHVGGRAAQAQHGERDGDRRQVRPEERRQPRPEQEAEVPLAQDFERRSGSHPRIMPLAKSRDFAYHFRMRPGSIRAAAPLVAAMIALVSSSSGASGAPPARISAAVREASRTYHVPARLLLTIGHLNTRWEMPARPAINGGYGAMDLTPAQLRRAARLAGIEPVRARHDLRENVLAGAALLAERQNGWYDRVAGVWGKPLADEVFGPRGRRPAAASPTQADYPGARWLPATRADYSVSNRPLSNRITTIVIHTTDGSYSGTLSWFRNPAAQASAHYVVRSSDGEITQMVREKDEAWHAGNGAVNNASVGIEHEAFTSNCSWYSDAMYRSSAQLVAYLATKYLIPVDRTHIIGHNEVPDPNHPGQFGGFAHHTDPGSCWNWPRYMALVRDLAGSSVGTAPQRIADESGVKAPRGWKRGTSAGAYARSFLVAAPSAAGEPVRFGLKIPVTGSYAAYGWWPGSAARNSSVPVGIDTTAGRRWIRVDERTGGGWTYLGTFPLSAKGSAIQFSPHTTAPGSIAADAVKVELLAPRTGTGLQGVAEGWASTARGLSATRDGGASWSSAAPPGVKAEQVRGVRFVGRAAWLVVATASASAKRPLSLYRTIDRGATWSSTPLSTPRDVDVAAPADVVAVDDATVFVALRLEPSRWSLSRGLLLRTIDGGATWTTTTLPAGGEIAFPTARDGWLAGGLAHERLYASHDGGRTWKQAKPPAAIKAAASTAYSLPVFKSPTEAVLPVSLAAGARSALAFEKTFDGGLSWMVAATVRLGKPLRIASSVPTAIVDSSLWLAAAGTKLVAVTDGGLTTRTVGTLPGAASAIQFASSSSGWAQVPDTCAATAPACQLKLFATADGGVTWTRLRPP